MFFVCLSVNFFYYGNVSLYRNNVLTGLSDGRTNGLKEGRKENDRPTGWF